MQPPCLLAENHETAGFDCSVPALNDYLARYALSNQRNDSGRTYVGLDDNRVIGFYTLASASVELGEAPERLKKGLPRHPVPAILLGRFAVDVRYQGRGLGKALLRDALRRIARVSDEIAVRAMVVDAKDAAARVFYQSIGFTAFAPESLRLYLLLKDLRLSIQ